MKYTGQFRDINENLYTVNITTNGDSSSTTNVVLGASPFKTEIETSDSHIYKPCKYSSATIKLLSNDYHFDLYASTAQANKVELIDNSGNIKWVGYLTPNLYSMGYENETEEIELEAIDGLSTLQYYKYTPIKGNKDIVNIRVIIDKLLSKSNCYSRYYISNATVLSGTTDSLPSKLYISENNFFDEDDEAMTMQEVLEEICQYLGLTCIANGDVVYFLDYDAIKQGYNTYNLFTVGNTSTYTAGVTLNYTKAIDGSDYVENGGKISLDNVYNKATVKDSLYTFDDAIPNIFDDIENYGENQVYTENLSIEDTTIGKGKHKVFMRYYTNPHYKSHYYTKDLSLVSAPSNVDYQFTQSFVGATITKGCSKEVDDWDEDITNLSFTDYLLIHSHNTNTTKTYTHKQYETADEADVPFVMELSDDVGIPVFESVIDAEKAFIGGTDVYFVIKGNYIQMDREGKMFIPENYGNKNDKLWEDNLWLKAKLEFNGQYWNGTQWTTTDTCFKLEFCSNGNKDHHINVDFPIKNTVTWEMGLDEEGYAVKLPNTNLSTTRPVLTLYTPHKNTSDYRCDAVFLKNFGISIYVADRNLDNENDSDTEYTNIIDEDFVEELNDIDFKICTWDNKAPNYSAVAYLSGSNYLYLDTVYNSGTKQTLRAEEQLIYRLVNQYSTPSVILQLNLKNEIPLYATITDKYLSGKTFIVDSMEIDWEMNKSTIKLIEKK